MEKTFSQFLKRYESKVVPLSKKLNLAYFKALISGRREDYKKAAELEIKLEKIHANKKDFVKLKKFKGNVKNQILKRQLDLLYNAYLGNQINPKKLERMVKIQTRIEKRFSTHRVTFKGKKISDNEVDRILRESKNLKDLETIWKASKTIGEIVSKDVLRLVKLRNESAKELGFKNYYEMSLLLSEQDPEKIEKIFNKLDTLTKKPFTKLKDEIDETISKRLNISKNQLMPWHYQERFFQEGPRIFEINLDKYYKNVLKLVKSFYTGIGLPVNNIIKRSDLFEKKGKYQHACCIDIDREGDMRIIANIKPNYMWMNTMLHECGHGVYNEFIDRRLPWLLRTTHTVTTEAVAMFFGRFASDPRWIKDFVGVNIPDKEAIAYKKHQQMMRLVFSRWSQVVYRFEKSMYEDSEQDLNKLWWDLTEKYQLLKKPERDKPDWAAKIHIAAYSTYYHNYMLGDLLSSQLSHYIVKNILKDTQNFSGRKDVGKYLKEKVFRHGNKYPWDELIKKATGKSLTPRYFADEIKRV